MAKLLIYALLLRIFILVFVLTWGREFSDPYYIFDDRNYEEVAQQYMQQAYSVFDFDTLQSVGALGYLESFWPCVMCVSAKLFHFLYAGRVINCILSTLCIKEIYAITYVITSNAQTSFRAALLFAFLPIYVIICCFPIKDFFLMFSVLYFFDVLVSWYKGKPVSLLSIMVLIMLLFCVSITRGGVLESLCMIACAFVMNKFSKNKRMAYLLLFIIVEFVMALIFRDRLYDAFSTKLGRYAGIDENGGLIKLIQMGSPLDIWKLPFSYFYAMLQPIVLKYFSENFGHAEGFWMGVIALLNISIFPIAIGNFLYVFMKKADLLFWATTTALLVTVSAISLGNSRHYFFVTPYMVIHFTLARETGSKFFKQSIRIGSVALVILIYCYSLI